MFFNIIFTMQISKHWTAMFLLILLSRQRCTECTKAQSFREPHIIVIMADDLGWNDVSFHGANQIPTPNIDALAYNGLILNRHYVLPTCTPSRTAFMTGLYPMKTGMQGYPLLAGEPNGIPLHITLLPQHLKRLGYTTRLVGKWHLGYYTEQHTPVNRGYDSFFGYYSGYIQYYNHTIEQNEFIGHDVHRDDLNSLNPDFPQGYFTDLITAEAEEIIKNHNVENPLYLQINHLAPHSSDGIETMEIRSVEEMNRTFGYIKDKNRQKFAAIVNTLDESVGRIVSSLRNAGLLNNSIILFMSDNGAQTEGIMENYGSNYPLRGLKFTLFEGAIRGVACLYSPLIKASRRVVNQLIHVTDWLPTLYSAAGGNPNILGDLDGVDQWAVLQNVGMHARDFVLLNVDEVAGLEGALINQFKLIKGAGRDYGDYYGDDGRGDSNPQYDTTQVLESATNKAINGNQSTLAINEGSILQLRLQSQVFCDRVDKYGDCSKQCLFNIFEDPCEIQDISDKYPEIVCRLENLIDKYRSKIVLQKVHNVDPNSDPKYFNGTWMPWITRNNFTCNIADEYWYTF